MDTNTADDDGYEYGYSHESNRDREGNYAPITSEFRPAWFATREEAGAACENDLRWRLSTFLIRRPKPEAPERVGDAIVSRSHGWD